MRLGHVLTRWRWAQQISLVDASRMMGISKATLSRIERGEAMDGRTLAKILTWLFETETLFHDRAAKRVHT
jgi:transcriptional regulator with XRE-family HTH domain